MNKKIRYFSTFTGIGGFEIGIQKAYDFKTQQGQKKRTSTFDTSSKDMSNDRNGGKQIIRYRDLSTTKRLQQRGTAQKDITNNKQKPMGVQQFTCIGYSEINKYANQIYEKHYPQHHNYGDITKINEKELPDFDLFVGGFPCQAFSIAGNRRGFEDTRGTLFFDVARILKEKQPRNFVLENVKGLLSHDGGRTFKTIITTLAELGYCVEWQVLNAKNFGVPQNRERVFIIGHLGGIPSRKVFPITGDSGKIGKEIKVIGTLGTDGWEKRFEEIRRVHSTDGISPTIPTGTGGGVMTKIEIARTLDANYAKGETHSSKRHTRRTEIINGTRIRRLTPLECERLMGYPDGWTEGLSDTQRYKCLGNGIVSNVVEEVIKRLY